MANKAPSSNAAVALVLLYFLVISSHLPLPSEAQQCRPSGKIRGKKPPSDQCNHNDDSPRVAGWTKATLTINSFEKGGEGGGPSECDNHYHSDDTRVVALSTGWFNHKKRCLKNIAIMGNGRTVEAMVVDECDSTAGCANNIVDASRAVWEALGVPRDSDQWGWMGVVWRDA